MEKRANVDVVIPIYNAPEFTRQAIEATLPELDANHRLILVDDASPDPAMTPLLSDYTGREWVTVHRSAVNRGFVGTCNLAVLELARPDADVILLNSDARPMRGFIRRLAETAGSNPEIGTVTAVSNNGSIASVLNLSDAERLAAEVENPLVLVPTGVGHLMYIKRDVIREYGLFDMAFSPGYGEEVDLCLRSADRYVSVVDTGCWCWHAGSASFLSSRSQLRVDHDALISKRYPHYDFEVQAYLSVDPLRDYRRRTLAATRDPRPRILHVVHSYDGVGGTEKHVQDLEAALSDQFLGFTAAPKDSLKLYSGTVPLDDRPYAKAGWPLTTSEVPGNDKEWAGILHELQAEPDPLPPLAESSSEFADEADRHGDSCDRLDSRLLLSVPRLHASALPRGSFMRYVLPGALQGPSRVSTFAAGHARGRFAAGCGYRCSEPAAANLVREVYPDLNIRVIPHGLRSMPGVVRRPSSKIRFGMIGYLAPVKGIEVILKAWPLVAHKGEAEFHIYGASGDPRYIERCAELGIHYHGAYREPDLPGIMSQIDIGVLPSQQPETFCYALTEFFAGGVPVIGSDYGNLADQIVNGVNGFKVPRDDARAWADTISMLIQDRGQREQYCSRRSTSGFYWGDGW